MAFIVYANAVETRKSDIMEIYIIKNDYNNQVYIGKTTTTMEKRRRQHLSQLNDGSAIHKAILAHGVEHFTWEIVESGIETQEELGEREKYWINYFDSYYNGYNMTKGGEGGNGTHAANLKKWRKENPDKMENNIKNLLKWQQEHPEEVKENNLKAAETRRKKYGKDITKKANESSRKKVKCIETEEVFNSVTEAALACGSKCSAHIGQVCNGKRKTAFGKHWEWIVKE